MARKTYKMRGILQTEQFKDRRLFRPKGSDKYSTLEFMTHSDNKNNVDLGQFPLDQGLVPAVTTKSALNGLYVFVITAEFPCIVFLRKHPHSAIDPSTTAKGDPRRGHSSIGPKGPGKTDKDGPDVLWAGEMSFTSGVLNEWTNVSGHYMPGTSGFTTMRGPALKQHAQEQTKDAVGSDGNPLLPIDKFREGSFD